MKIIVLTVFDERFTETLYLRDNAVTRDIVNILPCCNRKKALNYIEMTLRPYAIKNKHESVSREKGEKLPGRG